MGYMREDGGADSAAGHHSPHLSPLLPLHILHRLPQNTQTGNQYLLCIVVAILLFLSLCNLHLATSGSVLLFDLKSRKREGIIAVT